MKFTPDSLTQLQRLSSVSPRSRLRFVLSTGISGTEVTLHDLALEGTK